MKSVGASRPRPRRDGQPADRQERRVDQRDRRGAAHADPKALSEPARRPARRRPVEVTLFYVIITYNDVMAPDNPFVYGEIVTAAAFADREDERARLGRDLAAGQKVFLISPRRYGKSSLVRDVHARPGAAEDPHRRGHRRLVQLLHRLPRVLRPGAGRRRHAGQPAAALGRRAARRHPAGAALRRRSGRPRQVRARVPRRAIGARRRPRRHGSVRAARPHCRGAQAADGHRARRVPGDCRVRRRHRRARAARRGAGPAAGRLRVLPAPSRR